MNKFVYMAAVASVMAMAACSSKDKAADAAPEQTAPQEEAAVVEEVAVVEALPEDTAAAVAEVVEEQATVQEAPAAKSQKDEYVTTNSGLKYKVLRKGNGPKPAATDVVTVHYEGRLPNGQVFDSSYQRGEPTQFPLNRVISGWTEGLQLMPVGSKYQFYIPSNLAYGSRGAGGIIGPDQDLIFDVELISIP